jgi:hypothetical protein
MPSRIRSHLTFANVCSFIALFVALATGGAYAANTVFSTDIVNGQVTNADLADATPPGELGPQGVSAEKIETGAITSAKIADGAVAGADLANDAIGGSTVPDNSLTLADLRGADVNGTEITVKKGGAKAGGCTDPRWLPPGPSQGRPCWSHPWRACRRQRFSTGSESRLLIERRSRSAT